MMWSNPGNSHNAQILFNSFLSEMSAINVKKALKFYWVSN